MAVYRKENLKAKAKLCHRDLKVLSKADIDLELKAENLRQGRRQTSL
jgi:hypothetical protein